MFTRRGQTRKIVVHCSSTNAWEDIGRKEIAEWHKDRGWFDIGYHYVIRRNGVREDGRPYEVVGAHCRGHNHDSVGICIVGGRDRFDYTRDQMATLESTISEILSRHPPQEVEVSGHYEYNVWKECPRFDVKSWWYGDKRWT